MTSRTFTSDEEPPFGERITMMSVAGDRLVWDGKRWAWEDEAHSPTLFDAWPPDVDGPFYEVPTRAGRRA